MPRPTDLPIAVSAAFSVLAARVVIARTGFAGATRRYHFEPAAGPDADPAPLTTAADRAATVANRVVRLRVLGATCLPRSIAIARVVARYGPRTDIVLGVTKIDEFEAHAWVEAGGRRIDPSDYPDGVYQSAGRFTLSQ
jgi:hypothetical protein